MQGTVCTFQSPVSRHALCMLTKHTNQLQPLSLTITYLIYIQTFILYIRKLFNILNLNPYIQIFIKHSQLLHSNFAQIISWMAFPIFCTWWVKRFGVLCMCRYCGRSVPPSITSTDSLMTLLFVSHSSLATEGFSASYVSINATTGTQ